MTTDTILEEVRRARREYAEGFGFDIRALAADLRKREQQHPERVVTLKPRLLSDIYGKATRVAERPEGYTSRAPKK
jgi:hypothetical protein